MKTDRLLFDTSVFDVPSSLSFFSGLGASLPAIGANFISLQNIDADGNAANGILNNAGLSANLIAANAPAATAGFYMYFNTALNLNRLVYSTKLGDPTADLKVLARFTNQSGTAGVAALQQISAANIGTVAAVPEPATWAMMITGFGLVGFAMRKRSHAPAAVSLERDLHSG